MFITKHEDQSYHVSYFTGSGQAALRFEFVKLQEDEIIIESPSTPVHYTITKEEMAGLAEPGLLNCPRNPFEADNKCWDETIDKVKQKVSGVRPVLLSGGMLIDFERSEQSYSSLEKHKGWVKSTALLVPRGKEAQFLQELMMSPEGTPRKFAIVSGAYGIVGKFHKGQFSKHFKNIAYWFGYKIAQKWDDFKTMGYTHMVSASLGPEEMGSDEKFQVGSWDVDTARGFCEGLKLEGPLCPALHFKDANTVKVWGGDTWNVKYGQSILFEAEEDDFSNNWKEVALTSLAATGGFVLLGGGGPTVAHNLVKFTLVPEADTQAYTVCGTHGTLECSGASAFGLKDDSKIKESIKHAHEIAVVPALKARANEVMKKLESTDLKNGVADSGLADLSERVTLLLVDGSTRPMISFEEIVGKQLIADTCEGFDDEATAEKIETYANDAIQKILDDEVEESKSTKSSTTATTTSASM